METDQTVRCLLMATPGEPLCAACLAFACETSLTEMRKRIETLLEDSTSFQCGSTCAGCQRAVPTIFYRRSVPKCVHCSRPLQSSDAAIMIEGDVFHGGCLRLLITDEAIRISRALSSRSRTLIEESRARIRRALS